MDGGVGKEKVRSGAGARIAGKCTVGHVGNGGSASAFGEQGGSVTKITAIVEELAIFGLKSNKTAK